MEPQLHMEALLKAIPEGNIADTAWFEKCGVDPRTVQQSVKSGLLKRLARGVYLNPDSENGSEVGWEYVVDALQRVMKKSVHVGGEFALELHGFYDRVRGLFPVDLFTFAKLPSWINSVSSNGSFTVYRANKLFDRNSTGIMTKEIRNSNCILNISTKERAMCELLDCMQDNFDFHDADMLMEVAHWYDPKRVQVVLESCKSIKVKRLFLFFAKRNQVRWYDELDQNRIELGIGPRQTFKGGEFNSEFEITVPGDLDALAGRFW